MQQEIKLVWGLNKFYFLLLGLVLVTTSCRTSSLDFTHAKISSLRIIDRGLTVDRWGSRCCRAVVETEPDFFYVDVLPVIVYDEVVSEFLKILKEESQENDSSDIVPNISVTFFIGKCEERFCFNGYQGGFVYNNKNYTNEKLQDFVLFLSDAYGSHGASYDDCVGCPDEWKYSWLKKKYPEWERK